MQESRPEFKTQNFLKFGKGFTLVETLVALLILSTGIISIFVLISRDLSIASLIRDELIASHLAQEGVEVVRNLRDNDWHEGEVFGSTIPDGNWRIQWDSDSLIALGADPVLNIEEDEGIYSYDTGAGAIPTVFRRSIVISSGSGGEEKIITVRVEWVQRGVNKLVQAEEHLYNWR